MTTLDNAFLADIIASPDDDFPRLAYADWLEENEQEERAEFIRVQIGLASGVRMECGPTESKRDRKCKSPTCDWCRFRQREQELMARSPFKLVWLGKLLFAADLPETSSDLERKRRCEFRRGFIESITLATAGFLAHGKAIARACPLREVGLSDVLPYQGTAYVRADDALFDWCERTGSWNLERCHIPSRLFSHLPDRVSGVIGKHCNWYEYSTNPLARAALSRACVAWARIPE